MSIFTIILFVLSAIVIIPAVFVFLFSAVAVAKDIIKDMREGK